MKLLSTPVAVKAFVFLFLLLVGAPGFTLAINCPNSTLPAPSEDFAITKAKLEAQGLWQKNRSVPADPQLGDTWDWYIWDLGGMPVATLKPCTIRGEGTNVFVVVDDDEWNVGGMDQAAVDRIVDHFDNQSVGQFPDQGIWDLNTSHFGDPPNNLDGTEKIFLLYYRFDISSDGYFWAFDQYPDGSQAWASNEADVIYMATDNGDPGGDYMLAVMAHEFQHLIQFNTDQNEASWVNEGLSELAMWLFGHPDNISGFTSNTDNNLTSWGGAWADYIKVYLWTLYMYEQYGGHDLISDVSHNPINGMEGYRTSLEHLGLSPDMGDIFRDWNLANFLHDTSIEDGRYGYSGETLPLFWASRIHTSSPVDETTGTISGWAGESIRLLDAITPLHLTFDGMDTSDFRVTVSSRAPSMPTLVRHLDLDEFNRGVIPLRYLYNEAVLSVSNVNSSVNASYSYSTLVMPVVSVPEIIPTPFELKVYPNPFNPQTELSFTLPEDATGRVLVHDSRGRLVRVLYEGSMGAGNQEFPWNAKGLASGVYFGSLEIDGVVLGVKKITLVQ